MLDELSHLAAQRSRGGKGAVSPSRAVSVALALVGLLVLGAAAWFVARGPLTTRPSQNTTATAPAPAASKESERSHGRIRRSARLEGASAGSGQQHAAPHGKLSPVAGKERAGPAPGRAAETHAEARASSCSARRRTGSREARTRRDECRAASRGRCCRPGRAGSRGGAGDPRARSRDRCRRPAAAGTIESLRRRDHGVVRDARDGRSAGPGRPARLVRERTSGDEGRPARRQRPLPHPLPAAASPTLLHHVGRGGPDGRRAAARERRVRLRVAGPLSRTTRSSRPRPARDARFPRAGRARRRSWTIVARPTVAGWPSEACPPTVWASDARPRDQSAHHQLLRPSRSTSKPSRCSSKTRRSRESDPLASL